MRFLRRVGVTPKRLGILAGSFNPPTCAHVALIEAAPQQVDEVLCVIPQVFPHKIYHGATLDERLSMLDSVTPHRVPNSIAVSEGGLFVEISRECRQVYGHEVDLLFLCGRDAAERIVEWDYGEAGAVERMLAEFALLVAPRGGQYDPPARLADRISRLQVPRDLDEISSTEVRDRIRRGEPWEHLVPAAIVDSVRRIYSARD